MSSGTGGNFPAPYVAGLDAGAGQAFQPVPYPGTTQAANQALSGISNEYYAPGANALNADALGALNYGVQLPRQLSGPANQALGAGQSTYNALRGQAGIAPAAGQNAYNTLLGMYRDPMEAGGYVWENLGHQATSLEPYVTQALQAGFDPQNQLYNREFQKQQQQNLASQAMSGVGQSPYAAGLTAQGNENFNIDWQNQQLARQNMAANTAGGLESAIANLASVGSNALNQGDITGTNMLLGGTNALNQGLQTGEGMLISALNSLLSGTGAYGNLTGLGIQGLEGLLGAGGNALSQSEGLQGNQVQQLLQYLAGSSGNAGNYFNALLGSTNAGTNLFGATNQANAQNQQLQSNALGGIGQLGGQLGGAAILGNAISGGGAAAGGLGQLGTDAALGAAVL